jgi:tetratricopeptide (TPR) repeat protein
MSTRHLVHGLAKGLTLAVAATSLAGCGLFTNKELRRAQAQDTAPTLASLAQHGTNTLPESPTPRTPASTAAAIAAWEAYLKSAPANQAERERRAEALRRLGDLNMAEADRAAGLAPVVRGAPSPAAGTAAPLPTVAEEPDYRAAAARYEERLRLFPGAPGEDAVLYQLARAQEQAAAAPGLNAAAQAAAFDKTLATLTRLTREHPNTVHAEEAQFRRGEILFASGRYADAERAYVAVLAAPGTASAAATGLRERALYMQGWSLYKSNRAEEGLRPFMAVLDRLIGAAPEAGRDREADPVAAALPPSTAPDPLSRSERELLADTLRITGITLAQLQGAASIAPLIDSPLRQGYEHRLHQELASLYLRQERVKDATDTLSGFAGARPLHPQAPAMLTQSIAVLEAAGFQTPALAAKRDFVARYGAGSALRGPHPEVWTQAQPLVKAHLLTLARHHHATAQQTAGGAKAPAAADDVAQARRWYGEFIASYPLDAATPGQHLLLAELLQDSGATAEAATAYEQVAYQYPPHARSADAGYAALLLAPTADAAGQRRFAEQADRFASTFEREPRAASVLVRAAELRLGLGDGASAAGTARAALARGNATPEQQRTAWTVIGQAAFDAKAWAAAEAAYGQALASMPDTSRAPTALAERRAATVYQQGDEARKAGRLADALGHFDRVGPLTGDAMLAANAAFDAASVRVAMQDWPAAARALTDFRTRHRASPLVARTTPLLAEAWLQQERWVEAAGEFERLAGEVSGTASDPAQAAVQRRSALVQAATLHQRTLEGLDTRGLRLSPQTLAATRAWERLLRDPSGTATTGAQARWALAELARRQNDLPREQQLLQQLRRAEAAAPEAERNAGSRDLAALATIRLAEPLAAAYRRIPLNEPLQRQFKRKKAALDEVLAAYAQAANLGSRGAVSAATFHTAALVQDFGQALIKSERPRGLKAQALEQYTLMLEEQAFPFEEQAIGLHEANAQRARSGGHADEWTRRSLAELARLKPGRWARNEVLEEVLDVAR